MIKVKKIVVIIVLLMLSACGSSKSPVVSRSTVDRFAESEKIGGRIITIVERGDTWYGIAFANSVEVSDLTAWNGMKETDSLRIGQRIRLTKPIGFKKPQRNAEQASAVNQGQSAKVVVVEPRAGRAVVSNSTASKEAKRQNFQKPAPNTQVSKPKLTVKKQQAKPETQVVAKPHVFQQKNVRWSWPLKGRVVSKFSLSNGRKGIDIAGKQNQQIKVAAPGKVVYQGNGIKGYRNLIIIKHTDKLLSAYAHNSKVFVREGQWVDANQTISTVGLKNGKPLLHFEIRQNGKPVDPLRYLGS